MRQCQLAAQQSASHTEPIHADRKANSVPRPASRCPVAPFYLMAVALAVLALSFSGCASHGARRAVHNHGYGADCIRHAPCQKRHKGKIRLGFISFEFAMSGPFARLACRNCCAPANEQGSWKDVPIVKPESIKNSRYKRTLPNSPSNATSNQRRLAQLGTQPYYQADRRRPQNSSSANANEEDETTQSNSSNGRRNVAGEVVGSDDAASGRLDSRDGSKQTNGGDGENDGTDVPAMSIPFDFERPGNQSSASNQTSGVEMEVDSSSDSNDDEDEDGSRGQTSSADQTESESADEDTSDEDDLSQSSRLGESALIAMNRSQSLSGSKSGSANDEEIDQNNQTADEEQVEDEELVEVNQLRTADSQTDDDSSENAIFEPAAKLKAEPQGLGSGQSTRTASDALRSTRLQAGPDPWVLYWQQIILINSARTPSPITLRATPLPPVNPSPSTAEFRTIPGVQQQSADARTAEEEQPKAEPATEATDRSWR